MGRLSRATIWPMGGGWRGCGVWAGLPLVAGGASVEAVAMANGYMPRKDREALAWLANFAGLLVERPGVYKVSPAEAQGVRAAVDAFAAALGRATTPGTRTTVAVAGKDSARAGAELACRAIYLRIKMDLSIDDEEKAAIGVRPINPSRARVGPPGSAPELTMTTDLGHAHVLRYAAPGRDGSAKPTGVTGVQVFRRFAGGHAEYAGTFTRNPVRVECTSADDLKTAAYTARWITRRGLVGPWSRAVTARVNCPFAARPGVDLSPTARAA